MKLLSVKAILILMTSLFSADAFAVRLFSYDVKDKGKILGFNKKHPSYKAGNMGALTIPSVSEYNGVTPIVYIGKNAFKGENLTSLSLPDTLKVIDEAAFQDNRISRLVMPDSISTVNKDAFKNCRMTRLRLSRMLTGVGESAFEKNQLKWLYLPKSVKSVAMNSFADNQLTSVQFTDGISYIGESAFTGNDLRMLRLPGTLTHIADKAFYRNRLISVSFGNRLNYIGKLAFSENQLQTVKLPKSVNVLNESAFAHNKLITVDLPDSLKNISNFAFADNNLQYIRLNLVEFVGREAFARNNLRLVIFSSKKPEDENVNIKPMVVSSLAFAENAPLGTIINNVAKCSIAADSFPDGKYYQVPSEEDDMVIDLNRKMNLRPGQYTTGYVNLTFNTTGGGAAPKTIRTAVGKPTEILSKLKAERAGYEFVQWQLPVGKGFIFPDDEKLFVCISEDTALQAEWKLSVFKDDTAVSEFYDFTRALGLKSTFKNKIAAYKAQFEQNEDILKLKPNYYQIVVDAVNEGKEIAICRLNHGWNMVSTPVRRWRMDSVIPRQKKIGLTMYRHNGSGSYSRVDENDILEIGEGYWVYADFSRESQKYLDYAIKGNFTEPEKKLGLGWTLFGPTRKDYKAPEVSNESQQSCYWKPLEKCYVYKTVSEFKIGAAYWMLNLPKKEDDK